MLRLPLGFLTLMDLSVMRAISKPDCVSSSKTLSRLVIAPFSICWYYPTYGLFDCLYVFWEVVGLNFNRLGFAWVVWV